MTKRLNLLRIKARIFVLIRIAFLLQAIVAFEPALADGESMQIAPGQELGIELTLGASDTVMEIEALGSISGWTLQLQEAPNIWQETLVVKATGPWIISVIPDPITAGYMSEYDPINSEFVQGGQRLSNPLVIVAKNGNAVDLSKGGVLIQGSDGMVVPITFEQKVTWSDSVLTEGSLYQIGLTFSGLVG